MKLPDREPLVRPKDSILKANLTLDDYVRLRNLSHALEVYETALLFAEGSPEDQKAVRAMNEEITDAYMWFHQQIQSAKEAREDTEERSRRGRNGGDPKAGAPP